MPHIKGVIHAIGAICCVVLGAVITDIVREHIDVYENVTELTATLLIDMAQLPVDEEVTSIILTVGVLMFFWVFFYELKQL